MHSFRSWFPVGVVASLIVVACTEDDLLTPPVTPDSSNTTDAGPTQDASSVDATSPLVDGASTDSGSADSAVDVCGAASAALSATADAQAPVLDAAQSNLQRVTSNDAFCTTQKAGAHPSFGGFGYLLNVFLQDAEGDAPGLSDLVGTPGLVRFGASPAFDVNQKYDPDHGWSTQGDGFILQLCLDENYPAGAVTIAVDVADTNGHRSKAICVDEANDL